MRNLFTVAQSASCEFILQKITCVRIAAFFGLTRSGLRCHSAKSPAFEIAFSYNNQKYNPVKCGNRSIVFSFDLKNERFSEVDFYGYSQYIFCNCEFYGIYILPIDEFFFSVQLGCVSICLRIAFTSFQEDARCDRKATLH